MTILLVTKTTPIIKIYKIGLLRREILTKQKVVYVVETDYSQNIIHDVNFNPNRHIIGLKLQ